jgi:hypothetical protein
MKFFDDRLCRRGVDVRCGLSKIFSFEDFFGVLVAQATARIFFFGDIK